MIVTIRHLFVQDDTIENSDPRVVDKLSRLLYDNGFAFYEAPPLLANDGKPFENLEEIEAELENK